MDNFISLVNYIYLIFGLKSERYIVLERSKKSIFFLDGIYEGGDMGLGLILVDWVEMEYFLGLGIVWEYIVYWGDIV